MPFNHNDHYHRTLLRLLPDGCRTALDVGCGTGRFARRLAALGIEVDAVDPAAEAIEAAVAEGGGPRFHHADITRMELPEGRYDYVSCLASIHHVPFGTVAALRDALAPGGVLAILGCYPERSAVDYAWSLAAVPVNAAARVAVAARESRQRPESTQAPVKPPEMSLEEIRREADVLLPGATVRRLLFWRYLLVYRKA
ncbi:class I SAM-dependent methyltransferase [Nonomuraea sp. NPDC049480]|uniref:class I SAM-dependent methyltransferase n=1 Tax=Nonomuraea sp. NPDC049480 TaxID=3364353 RepID=UPI0037ABE7EE